MLSITQEDLALEVGISQGTVSRIEAGKMPIGSTKMLYDRWAEDIARARRLRRDKRLSWEHLLE